MQACGEAYSELSCESLQLPTGSFQNQPLPENQGKIVRPRKRGIQALLADSTNIEAADFKRFSKEQAEVKLQAYVTGYEKRDHFAHFPNFHFKTLVSLDP